MYKSNFAKIGTPIIGANNISLIVSSVGKYQYSKRIEYDINNIKISNITSANIIINCLFILERFTNRSNIDYVLASFITEVIESHVFLISSLVKVGCTKNIKEVSPSSFALTSLSLGLNPVLSKDFSK